MFILKAKWKEKLSTVNNCRGGEVQGSKGAWEEQAALIKGMWLAVGQRNRHFKIRRSYAHQILLQHHHIFLELAIVVQCDS